MSLPSAIEVRDLALRVQDAVPVEHYLEGRNQGSRYADRYTIKGTTFDVITGQRDCTLEAYGKGWLYRILVTPHRVTKLDFVGDTKRCLEDVMMLKLSV